MALEGVTAGYPGITALEDVHAVFRPGQVTALVGGDGAGKSTLLRVLTGRAATRAGRVTPLSSADLGYEPSDSGTWRNLTVQENIEFVGRARRMDKAVLAERAERLLAQAGLDHARSRLSRDLSGGMRQKLGFVLATIHRPPVVLLDEPTTGVDPVSRADLWELVGSAAADGAVVVMATTYLDEAERCGEIVLLERGRVLASGPPDEVAAGAPGYLYRVESASVPDEQVPPGAMSWRRGLRSYVWSPAPVVATGVGLERVAPDLENATIAHVLASRPADEVQAARARHRSPSAVRRAASGEVVAAAKGVSRRFGTFQALDRVDLEVRAGQIVGLLGGNGAGKTTLIRNLLGLDMPTQGTVAVLGGAADLSARRRIGYVAQGVGLYTGLTVRENVEFAAAVYDAAVGPALSRLDPATERRLVREVPLGTQREVAVVAATTHDPDLLVLDEPTSGMDRLGSVELWRDLRGYADEGAGVLITTHDMREAEQCDTLVLLVRGQVAAAGTLEDLLAGREVFRVDATQWQASLEALRSEGMRVSLHGRGCRVLPEPGVDEARVREVLATAGVAEATVTLVPASLQELLAAEQVLRDSSQ
ncbi:ATP-binding cassette domain-containing protein [Cellulomonas xiejunii]|uniref:ATP-binding cassette domain-containing protein n=1 Tax=Cellulomonas xiejunii TaxID=2968083 RepID=UPI001D0EF71A|nr:ATP-binding cassette domain-containing protein [Cellulomonas xiejunii]